MTSIQPAKKAGRPRKYTPEEASERRRKWAIENYYKNKEKCAAASKRYYDNNRDKILEQKKRGVFNPIPKHVVLDIIGNKPKVVEIKPHITLEVVENEPELTLEVVEDESGVIVEIIE